MYANPVQQENTKTSRTRCRRSTSISLVHNALEFVHCQKAFVHLNEGDGLREWVELDKTGVPCAGNGFLEQLHHLRGGVVADLLVHTQEVAEAVDKFLVDFRQWNVFILFFP